MHATNIGNNTALVNGYVTAFRAIGERSLYRPMLDDVLARVHSKLKEHSLTPSAASVRAGLSKDAIRNMERAVAKKGREGVSTRTIAALAPILKTTPGWLLDGGAEPAAQTQNRVVRVVGYVGAGAQIHPVETEGGDQVLDEVELDFPMPDGTVAAIVRGDSMLPVFEDGDLIGYYRDALDPLTVIGRTCVVKVFEGPMYVKTLKRGSAGGLFTLTSFNATDIEDVAIEWAAPFQFRVSRFQWRAR